MPALLARGSEKIIFFHVLLNIRSLLSIIQENTIIMSKWRIIVIVMIVSGFHYSQNSVCLSAHTFKVEIN